MISVLAVENGDRLSRLKVRREMEELLQLFVPDPQHHPAQFAFNKKLQRHGTNTGLTYCTAMISQACRQIT
ncbi:hypothetical protein [Nostoc sp.]|uniref:hypothetical protein n=1 Tax=Nostoc sp. TaxID=1180 RepID=UPI002FF66E3D